MLGVMPTITDLVNARELKDPVPKVRCLFPVLVSMFASFSPSNPPMCLRNSFFFEIFKTIGLNCF